MEHKKLGMNGITWRGGVVANKLISNVTCSDACVEQE